MVMRPKGPLPPRVYWMRRLLLVIPVLVVFGLVWSWLPGGGGTGSAAADPGGRTTPAPTHPVTTGHPPSKPTGGPSPGDGTSTTSPTSPTRSTRSTTAAPPKSVPTGRCDPGTLRLAVSVSRAVEGAGAEVGLRLATTDGSTCSLGVTPAGLEIRITSGQVTIWQSNSCPDGLPAKNVVVRPQPAVVYSFHWDGHVDPDACTTGAAVARPGGYWVEAGLIGGEPHKTYFPVVPVGHGL